MKKIIIKAIIAIALAILLAKSGEMGVGFGIILAVFLYILFSWFGMIYKALYGFGGVLRCVISLIGSVLVITAPMEIFQVLLPDNWLRTTLMTIGTIIMFIIPCIQDWKDFKS